jgi:hypothetical protein
VSTESPVRDMASGANLKALLHALLRAFLSVAAIVWAYYWVPAGDGRSTGLEGLVFLVLGLALFGFVFYRQIARVTRADHPVLRAIEALCSILALFVCFFALLYYASSVADPTVFSEPLSRTDSLYFTVTVFSTVGFGDITPVGTTQRVMTMFQMLLDVAFLAVLVRVLTMVTQATLAKRRSAGGWTPREQPAFGDQAEVVDVPAPDLPSADDEDRPH